MPDASTGEKRRYSIMGVLNCPIPIPPSYENAMANPHLQELHRLMSNRYAIDRDDMTYGDWICANTRLRGRPFSFTRYPFQRQIVNDMHPNLGCIKCSQIGLSEVQIRKALAFLKRNNGTTLIYTYPDDDMRKRNSQTRIMPVIEQPVFNMDLAEKPVRSISLLQIDQSFMHVTGSKEGDATSTAADVIFNDEIDLTDPHMLALFNSRVQGSDWKIIQKFSTPTYTGYGIDSTYGASDQHEYLIKCDSCNHWQFPLFNLRFIDIPNFPGDFNDIMEIDERVIDHYQLDIVNSQVVCERCRAPLDLGREDNRAYVPKYPSRTHARGYKVNCFSVSTLPPSYVIGQLLEYKRLDFLRGFKNTVLGEPDDAGANRMGEAEINMAITPHFNVPPVNKEVPVWVGIDVGQTCHITIGQGWSLEQVETVTVEAINVDRLIERVVQIKSTYWLVGGLIDRHPYEPTANAVREASGGLILPCEYRGSKEFNVINAPDGTPLYVQAERTTLLDEVPKAIRKSQLRFSGYGILRSAIVTHLRNMVREEKPEQPAIWKKLDNADHIFHSTGFMLSAIKLKRFKEVTSEDHRTTTDVAVVDLGGYNAGVYGHIPSSRNKTSWRTPLLR